MKVHKNIRLIPLNMELADGHNHPQIKVDETQYLVKLKGEFFCGRFNKEWFGLNFDGWYNSIQFDAPGTNRSNWEQIWEIQL